MTKSNLTTQETNSTYVRKIKFGLLELPYFASIDGIKIHVYVQEWNGDMATCRTEENIEVKLHFKNMSSLR